MSTTASYTLARWGPSGVFQTPVYPMQSFVQQFLQLLYPALSDLIQSTRNTGNVSRTVLNDTNESWLSLLHCGLESQDEGTPNDSYPPGHITDAANPGADQKGVVVGTDNTAVAVTDYKLWGALPHGTGGNQLVYYGTWGYSPTVSGNSATFIIERIFYNLSGGALSITEAGLYCTAPVSATGSGNVLESFCIVRDVLPSAVALGTGDYLRVAYTFRTAL